MKFQKVVLTIIAITPFVVTACSSNEKIKVFDKKMITSEVGTMDETSTVNKELTTFKTITASEANKMMAEEQNFIVLDVRTEEEYHSGHIKNAFLLPYDQIDEKAEQMLGNKDKNL